MDSYDGRNTGKIGKCFSSYELSSKFTPIAIWLESYIAITTKSRKKEKHIACSLFPCKQCFWNKSRRKW